MSDRDDLTDLPGDRLGTMEAVTVASDRLVFKPRLAPVA
jgi:hypothetical protein